MPQIVARHVRLSKPVWPIKVPADAKEEPLPRIQASRRASSVGSQAHEAPSISKE